MFRAFWTRIDPSNWWRSSIEEAKNFSSSLFASGLFVGHDPVCSRKDDVSELTRRKKVDNPLLNFVHRNIESRRDYTALVQSSVQFNNNLVRSVIVDDFEFPNVSMLLHASKELDNNLGRRSDHDLSSSTLFSVGDCLQTISEYWHANHLNDNMRRNRKPR